MRPDYIKTAWLIGLSADFLPSPTTYFTLTFALSFRQAQASLAKRKPSRKRSVLFNALLMAIA